MKNINKILAICLILIMFSQLSMVAFAAEVSEASATAPEAAVTEASETPEPSEEADEPEETPVSEPESTANETSESATESEESVEASEVEEPIPIEPIPGDNGKIKVTINIIKDNQSDGFTLNWTKAESTISAQTALKYYVYSSGLDNVHTVEDCEANGYLWNQGGTTDMDSYVIRIISSEIYFLNVVVEDETGNKAAYQAVKYERSDTTKAIAEADEKLCPYKDEYLRDVIFASSIKASEAKAMLQDRGYYVYDVNLNEGIRNNYVYMGYRTTKDVKLALTDFRIRRLTTAELAGGEGLVYNNGGIPYAGCLTVYDEKSFIDNSTFGGANFIPNNQLWFASDSYTFLTDQLSSTSIEAMAIGMSVSNALIDAAGLGMIEEFTQTLAGAHYGFDTFLCAYISRDIRAGTPIYADFLFRNSPSYNTPKTGYEPLAYFSGVTAVDLNNHVGYFTIGYRDAKAMADFSTLAKFYTNSTYESKPSVENFLYYRTDPYPTDQEYLGEVIVLQHTETLTQVTSYATSRGYKIVDMDMFAGVKDYGNWNAFASDQAATIAYKTTRNPYRALTDIKFLAHPEDGFPFPETIGNRTDITYTAVQVLSEGYGELVVGFKQGDSWPRLKYECFQRNILANELGDGSAALYTSTSPNAGPKLGPNLFFNSSAQNLPQDKEKVTMFFSNDAADLTKNSGSTVDMYMAFDREPTPLKEKAKYVADFVVIMAETDEEALLQAIYYGASEYIYAGNERYWKDDGSRLSNYVSKGTPTYICIIRTDKKSNALTGIMSHPISEDKITDNYMDGKIEYKYHSMRQGGYDVIDKDGYVPLRAKRYWQSFLTTKSVRAGEPITDIFLDRALDNTNGMMAKDTRGMPVFIQNTDRYEDMGGGYYRDYKNLYVIRESNERPKYISAVYLTLGIFDDERGAQMDLFKTRAQYIVNCDLNINTGGYYVYLGFDRTDNIAEALTGVTILRNQGCPESKEINGITWYLASSRDVNKGNGQYTDDCYLYYTNDKAYGPPLTDITVFEGDNEVDGWMIAYEPDGECCDFNRNARQYLSGVVYKTKDTTPRVLHVRVSKADGGLTASVFSDPNIPVMVVLVTALVGAGIGVFLFHKRKNGKKQTKIDDLNMNA